MSVIDWDGARRRRVEVDAWEAGRAAEFAQAVDQVAAERGVAFVDEVMRLRECAEDHAACAAVCPYCAPGASTWRNDRGRAAGSGHGAVVRDQD